MKTTDHRLFRRIILLLGFVLSGLFQLQAQPASVVLAPNPFGLLAQKGDGNYTDQSVNGCTPGVLDPRSRLTFYERIHAGNLLSTPYVRMDMAVDNWLHMVDQSFASVRTDSCHTVTGVDYEARRLAELDLYRSYLNAGYKITLNIGYRPALGNFASPNSSSSLYDATRPLNDSYKRAVALMLQTVTNLASNGHTGNLWGIAIENEENWNNIDHDAASNDTLRKENVADYLTEMAYAIDVAHNGLVYSYSNGSFSVSINFAGGVKVTDGGLIDHGMRMAVWSELVGYNADQYPYQQSFTSTEINNGKAFAQKYLRYVNNYFSSTSGDLDLGDPTKLVYNDPHSKPGHQAVAVTLWLLNGVTIGSTTYPGLLNPALGLDYLNFHSYMPWPDRTTGLSSPASSPFSRTVADELPVLDEYAGYLKRHGLAVPMITNEIGSFVSWEAVDPTVISGIPQGWGSTSDPENAVTAILGKVQSLGLPLVIWYSGNKDFFFNYDSNDWPLSYTPPLYTPPPVKTQFRYIALTDSFGDLKNTPVDVNLQDITDGSGAINSPPTTNNKLGEAFYNFVTGAYNGSYWKTTSAQTVFTDDFSSSVANWYVSATSGLVYDSAAGMMRLDSASTSRQLVRHFTLNELNVGDTLTLSFKFKYSAAMSTTDALYFGLFNSTDGTQVSANNFGGVADSPGVTTFRNYDGYRVRAPLAASATNSQPLHIDARTRTTVNSALMCDSSTDLAYLTSDHTVGVATLNSNANTTAANVLYQATFTIERSGYRALRGHLKVVNISTSATVYELDTGDYTIGRTSVDYTDSQIDSYRPLAFDTVAFGYPTPNPDSMQYRFDDVTVTHQAAPTPTTEMVSGDVTINTSDVQIGTGSFGLTISSGLQGDTTAHNYVAEWYKLSTGFLSASGSNPSSSAISGTLPADADTYVTVVANPAGWSVAGPFTAWDAVNINGSGGANSFNSSTYTYTLNSPTGGSIGSTADKIYFVNQAIGANSTIVAHVRLPGTATAAADEAGLIVRSDQSTAGAPYMFIGLRRSGLADPNRHACWQYRTTSGGGSTKVETDTISDDECWVRLRREGSVYTVWYATTTGTPTETDWVLYGTQTISALNSSPRGGLCVGAVSSTVTGVFTNVSVTSP